MSALLRSPFRGCAEGIGALVAAVIKDFLMRVQHWISPVLSLLVLLASSPDTRAQDTSNPYGSPGVVRVPSQPAAYAGGHPAAPQSAYDQALMAPEMYGGYPPAYTPVAAYPFQDASAYGGAIQPWPQISPFDEAYSSHYIAGGLWENATRGFGKKWYANAEYLLTRTKRPGGILGDADTQSYFIQVHPELHNTLPYGENQGGVSLYDVDNTIANGETNNYFNRVDLDSLGDVLGKGGRITTGFWNPDDSGVAAKFWFTGDSKEVFDARKEATRVQDDLADLFTILTSPFFIFSDIGNTNKFDVFQTNLLNLRGLPLNVGGPYTDPFANGGPTPQEDGLVVPYDLYFQVVNRSQSLGANLDYFFTPIIKRKTLMVRPMAGARYLRIDEGMDFVGIDSGMLYNDIENNSVRDLKVHPVSNGYDDNGDGIVDEAGVTNESEGAAAIVYHPPSEAFAFTRAFIDMDTLSHLYGPEVGLRYDLGGEKFKLTGETKLGLMVNREKINLRGDNIGNITRSATLGDEILIPDYQPGDDNNIPPLPFTRDFVENDPHLFTPTAANPHPNAFRDEEEHVHFSPIFEQSIFADVNIFGYVPVLKDIHVLEQANFRIGYTFIWAGEIAQTNESIVYQGKPTAGLFPYIDLERESWWTSNWSFGVSWDF